MSMLVTSEGCYGITCVVDVGSGGHEVGEVTYLHRDMHLNLILARERRCIDLRV